MGLSLRCKLLHTKRNYRLVVVVEEETTVGEVAEEAEVEEAVEVEEVMEEEEAVVVGVVFQESQECQLMRVDPELVSTKR